MSKLRLAYFSPLPPIQSGIADYSAALIPPLAQLADLTLFATRPEKVPVGLQQFGSVLPIATYPEKRWEYDMAIYQMGNNLVHDELYEMALRYGGVVVLHDYGLHRFVLERTAGQKRYGLYAREMAYEGGGAGWLTAEQIRFLQERHPVERPLNGRLLDSSLGMIAHSEYVCKLVTVQRPILPTAVIPMVDLLAGQTVQTLRYRLPVDGDTVIFMSGGHMTAAMQIGLTLWAFAQVRRVMPNVHYVLAGQVDAVLNLPALLKKLDLQEKVTVLGYIDEIEQFSNWLATADVIVNLRYPTLGETSAVGMRGLAAGRPLLVFDHGWYAELPDEVAVKVPVMDEDALVKAMVELARDKEKRAVMGEAAEAHIRAYHRPEQVSAAYVGFVEQILSEVMGKLQ